MLFLFGTFIFFYFVFVAKKKGKRLQRVCSFTLSTKQRSFFRWHFSGLDTDSAYIFNLLTGTTLLCTPRLDNNWEKDNNWDILLTRQKTV